jgi:hypothetical protein
MASLYGQAAIFVTDYDGEKTTIQLRGVSLTAANLVAQTALIANAAAYLTGITLGTINGYSLSTIVRNNVDRPALAAAQRELKWLVQYHDSVTLERGAFTLPCADTAKLDSDHRPYALMSDAVVQLFITQIQGYMRSAAGNPIVIDTLKLVGRAV